MEKLYSLHGLSSERLDFRRVLDEDFEPWMAFCAHPEALRYIPIAAGPDPKERCKAWFDRVEMRYRENTGGMHTLIERKTGLLIGQCGLMHSLLDETHVIELGYAILPEHWGKGFAVEAAGRCIETVFENQWGNEVIALIEVGNQNSVSVAQKLGMKPLRQIQRDALLDVYSISSSSI